MGSPLFSEPRHVGRPNVGDRRRFHALVDEILDRNWLTNSGPVVERFEEQVAELLGVRHCVAMCNGTVALEIALAALDITGEVIVPSYTFVATAHAVTWRGARAVFADIDPATHSLDPVSVRARISPRTQGIIAVHLWGRPAPVRELQAIADEAGVDLMLDAAHAFGCSLDGTMVGSFGRLEVLSFHATKFFNSLEGGAIVTNDDDLAQRARLMRNFGFAGFDRVVHLGTNAKMTEMSAAMGLVNLEALDGVIAVNRANHRAYQEAIEPIDGVRLLSFDESQRNNYQYAVLELDPTLRGHRDTVIEHLHRNNVLARKYFWPGCHRMVPYVDELATNLPFLASTEDVAPRIVVLPTGTSVDEDDCRAIAGLVGEALP